MIKQRSVTYKTASAILSYSEIGDVVVNVGSATTMTLPTPAGGLWYRISNVGSGEVSINYSGTITSLKETEQALLLSNGSSAWWMSKGSGAMTKAEIEAVLTGEITTHTHPETSHDFLDLGQVPASFTDQGGKVLAVNKAENAVEFIVAPGVPAGGTINQLAAKNSNDDYDLKWMDAPEAANGIPAGGTTNQLFAKNSNADYDGKWVDAPEAANGIPSGGTANQILAKDTGDDYDVSWIAVPNAPNGLPTGGTTNQVLKKIDGTNYNTEWATPATTTLSHWIHLWYGNPSISSSSYLSKGNYIVPKIAVTIRGISAVVSDTAGNTFKFTINEVNSSNVQQGAPLYDSGNITAIGGAYNQTHKMTSPVTLEVGKYYIIAMTQTTSGQTYAKPGASTWINDELTGCRGYAQYNGAPLNGVTWTVTTGASPYAFGMLIDI